jgi:hypothetical protein
VFEKAYAAQKERVRIALKGRPLYEFGKYNLIAAQINELHQCIVDAHKRDPLPGVSLVESKKPVGRQ